MKCWLVIVCMMDTSYLQGWFIQRFGCPPNWGDQIAVFFGYYCGLLWGACQACGVATGVGL